MDSSASRVDAVEGPSFGRPHRVVATAMLAALLLWAGRAWMATGGHALAPAQWAGLLALIAVVGTGYGYVLGCRTRIDERTIAQWWLWRREVRIAEITQARLIHFASLSWLVVPRLLVRTGGLTMWSFSAGDARLLAAFRAIAEGRGRPGMPPPSPPSADNRSP